MAEQLIPSTNDGGGAAGAAPNLAEVLSSARQKFVDGFAGQCEALADLASETSPEPATVEAAVKLLHRMAGLGGTIGFQRVSREAAAFEDALRAGTPDPAQLGAAVASLRNAFDQDRAEPPREAPAPQALGTPLTVMLVEDNLVQRTIVSGQLRMAGHRPIAVSSGEEALAAARRDRPDVILLDVELPGINGHEVCRMIKEDAALASVPVAFLTAHASLDHRLAGLSHGADDFLTKPLDARELALRLQLLNKHRATAARVTQSGDVLAYDAFCAAASDVLSQGRGALALLRTPADQTSDIATILRDEIRRRDLCGEYDRTHVAVLLPDTSATAARQRLAALVEKCLAHGISGVYAGVAASEKAGGRTLAELVEEADEALARARYEKLPAALRADGPREEAQASRAAPLVLIADDDPDVVRILDAHLGAGGFRRTIAFDGSRALEEVRAQRPEVVILDLMMPRLTGFDVLAGLRDLEGERPRIIVLSARGREDDVIRAFSFGADDFMTKPFNPQELLARVARLVR